MSRIYSHFKDKSNEAQPGLSNWFKVMRLIKAIAGVLPTSLDPVLFLSNSCCPCPHSSLLLALGLLDGGGGGSSGRGVEVGGGGRCSLISGVAYPCPHSSLLLSLGWLDGGWGGKVGGGG